MSNNKYSYMRIEEKNGEKFLVIESKEDLEEFRKMLIEAYYELHQEHKPKSSKWLEIETYKFVRKRKIRMTKYG